MSEKRPDGHYWVRRFADSDPAPRLFKRGFFRIDASHYPEGAFHEIGPPCSRDDAEQLQKARDVLRRIRSAAAKIFTPLSRPLRDIIDESGVRL